MTRKDARNGVATFTYDALNRMKQKSYANTLASIAYTPTVNYTYDQAGANSIGHLTQVEAAGVSTTAYSAFDVLGRPGQSAQNTANNNFVIQYAYNLTGAITSETYPSGRVIATSYDGANRIQSISGMTAQNPTPAQYTGTTAIAYAPQGAIQTLTRGDGLTESWSYNNRLQPASVSVGNGSNPRLAFGLDLYYCPAKAAGCATNNGNLATASLSILGVDQNFTYDGANRVLTAEEGTAWSQTYGYDRFGNRRVSGGVVLDPFTPTATTNFNANNQLQIQNSGYDAAGNLTHIGGYGFAWDAENRMVASAIGNVRTDYSYDGDGRRVMKQSDTSTTIFVYDVSGHLATEYSTAANLLACTTCYFSVDQLGSTRVVTDQNGGIVARHDYLPFGEEIPQQYSGRTSALHFGATENIAQKFTGKERDSETGMDYFGARYYSGGQGRFTSPDEVFADQHPADPQSWNLYAYVRNNPLKNTDPNGKDCQNGLVACGNYVLGGAGAVVNAFSSGIINAPNRLADSIAGLFNGGQRVFGDVVPDAFTPMNEDQREGMQAANAIMLVSPLAEASATALVDAIGTGARVESGTASAVQETGTIYKLPAQAGSGKPYIGRAIDVDKRMATRIDGRTGPAEKIDTFNAQDRTHGQYKEQKAINANGGVQNLDNKRNEVNARRYQELKKKYEDQQ